MVREIVRALGLALILALLAAAPAAAQQRPSNHVDLATPTDAAKAIQVDQSGVPSSDTKAAIRPGGFPVPVPPFDPAVVWKDLWICRNAGPAEVTGFRVQCPNSTFLDFHIADCCVPGDHWQLKGKAWDANPNTGVTTSPGPANVYGVAGRAYNYGGTPANPGVLDAYVECSYLNGVNIFLADSFIAFSSDGNCVVTPDPSVQRIDRAP